MIVIISAFSEELRAYRKLGQFRIAGKEGRIRLFKSPGLPHVALLDGAIGKQRALDATKLAIDRFEPDLLISAGFSGALQPQIARGQAFVCRTVAHWDSAAEIARAQQTAVDPSEASSWRHGAALTVDSIANSQQKGLIGQSTGADVVDMESWWVSETARSQGVGCEVVRVVLDTLDEDLPAILAQDGAIGEPDITKLGLRLVRSPSQWRAMCKLAMDSRAAGKILANVLVEITKESAAAMSVH